MGVLTAFVFVLGLMGVAVWFARRFGGATVNPRSRIAMEIVQRIPFGPKAGLAVVRVGEKVMAVSVGPDGIKPLFELDEADRQRIIASSQMVTPFASSAVAGKAIASFLPNVIGQLFDRKARAVIRTARNAVLVAPIDSAPNDSAAMAAVVAPSSEAFGRYAPPVASTISKTDSEFSALLNIAMSGATRLAVFVGIAALASATVSLNTQAQVAPPVVPPVVAPPVVAPSVVAPSVVAPPVATSTAGTASTVTPTTGAPSAVPPTTGAATTTGVPAKPALPTPPVATPPVVAQPTSVAPKISDSLSPGKTGEPPSFVLPKNFQRPRTAPVKTATPKPTDVGTFPKQVAKTDSTKSKPAPAKTNAANATTIIPSARAGSKTNSAPLAPIASGDDAFAKLIPQMDLKMGDGKDGGLRLSGTVGIVVMMGLLTLLPTLLLMMTGFTRILIVLHFLKQAMGTQAAPPAQLLAAMALLLTGFVMAPTFSEINKKAVEPWMDGKISQVQMMEIGVKPMRVFMEKQTKEADLKTFIGLSHLPRPNSIDDVPLHVLMSAFVASELRTSFYIGFIIYLPFIVIDAVVASVLMSMGMFMLPPAMISMPFKLLLFVLVDGWGLTIRALVESFK